MGVYVICLHMKFHMSRLNGLSVSAIKPNAKENILLVTKLLLNIVSLHFPKKKPAMKVRIFLYCLLLYIISGPCFRFCCYCLSCTNLPA